MSNDSIPFAWIRYMRQQLADKAPTVLELRATSSEPVPGPPPMPGPAFDQLYFEPDPPVEQAEPSP